MDPTPKILTKYLRATASATNQNRIMRPDMPIIRIQDLGEVQHHSGQSTIGQAYSQFFRAHQRVKMKKTARTKQATLLAFVSNPQAMRHAPIKEEPR